jgi:hypothetical protein
LSFIVYRLPDRRTRSAAVEATIFGLLDALSVVAGDDPEEEGAPGVPASDDS